MREARQCVGSRQSGCARQGREDTPGMSGRKREARQVGCARQVRADTRVKADGCASQFRADKRVKAGPMRESRPGICARQGRKVARGMAGR
jgi:hypothetical protein